MACCNFSIAIHGGAGVISKLETNPTPYYASLRQIISQVANYAIENENNPNINAVDVAEFGVRLLEDEELFNAGKGAVFTSKETHELEASIMDGLTLECGAASLLRNVKNPISAAKVVMKNTQHVYLAGDEAQNISFINGLTEVDQSYFSTEIRREQLYKAKEANQILLDHNNNNNNNNIDHENNNDDNNNLTFSLPPTPPPSQAITGTGTGTVGCVCHYKSNLAAATSTGGMTNKLPGRIGDSPIIGAGTYANNRTCAVSATGKGELFIRYVVAYDISAQIEYGGLDINEACRRTIHEKLPSSTGGVIAIDSNGKICFDFNCSGMFRGSAIKSNNELVLKVGIWDELID